MKSLLDLGALLGIAPRGWAEPASTLAGALGLASEAATLGGNKAFALDGRDNAWLLLSGSIDVFYLVDGPVEAARGLDGVRHHFMRIAAGGVVFGLSDPGEAWRFLAVPSNGAEVVVTTRQDLLSLLAGGEEESASAAEAALQGWVEQVAVERGAVTPPRSVAQVVAGARAAIPKGMAIAPGGDSPLWIAAPPDALSLPDGVLVALATDEPPMLPLTGHWWMRAESDLEVAPLAMGQWLRSGRDILFDLDALHDVALTAFARHVQKASHAEVQRIVEHRRLVRTSFGTALRSLVGTISPQIDTVDLPSHPLLAAADVVCRHMGSRLPLPKGFAQRVDGYKDPIPEISRASGFQIRKIDLAGPWWTQDMGPVLAFHGEAGRPCALLPSSPGRYVLVDPQSGAEQRVTAKVAADIQGPAYAFYRPLPQEKLSPGKVMRFGFAGAGRDGWAILWTLLLNGILSLAPPVITGWVMDPVIPQGQVNQLAVLIAAMVIAGLAASGFSLIQQIAIIRIEGQMAHRVQAAVWDRLLKLPASFFRNFSVGDLANRAQGIDAMRQMLSGAMTASLMQSVSALFSLGLMVWYSWRLALVTAVVCAVYMVIVYFLGRRVLSRNRDMMMMTGRIQGLVLQLLGGVPRLRVSGAERSAFARWAQRYSEMLQTTYQQTRLSNAVATFRAVFNYLGIIALLVMIGFQGKVLFSFFHQPVKWEELNGSLLHALLPTGNFVAFYTAYGQFLAAVFGLTQIAVQLVNLPPLFERVQPILDAREETVQGADEDPGEILGEIEVRDVHFRYRPELPLVLHGLTLKAEPGQFVAVVGPSGAGKSSLVRLLLGFETPELGSLFVDGKDVGNLEKRALRRNFGVVLQNGRVLSGTIFHNITAGANLTREDAWEAARLAGLDRDIEQMPMGMDTFLSEGATTISGGQRQRLMIARAIVRRPRILIFDEATSALDNETQAIVSRGLETLKCTRIVIAHRLSTIINADLIYVMVGGKVVESGKYTELMELGGIFADLARRQIA